MNFPEHPFELDLFPLWSERPDLLWGLGEFLKVASAERSGQCSDRHARSIRCDGPLNTELSRAAPCHVAHAPLQGEDEGCPTHSKTVISSGPLTGSSSAIGGACSWGRVPEQKFWET